MSSGAKVSLMSVHGALSHLAFAVGQTLRPLNVGVRVCWDQWVYLCVEVECYEKDRQMIVDRLSHGALEEPYDYRFTCSYPTGGTDPTAWITVKAYPDMTHDDAIIKKRNAA